MKDKERISSVVSLEDTIDDTEEILESNEQYVYVLYFAYKRTFYKTHENIKI